MTQPLSKLRRFSQCWATAMISSGNHLTRDTELLKEPDVVVSISTPRLHFSPANASNSNNNIKETILLHQGEDSHPTVNRRNNDSLIPLEERGGVSLRTGAVGPQIRHVVTRSKTLTPVKLFRK